MGFNNDKFDVLHNFISPVTGRILSDYNYVLVGNKQGIAIPSPILIDIRLDLIALRKRYNSLVKGDLIIGHPNNELPNAQVLFNMPNGYLYNTEGIVSTNTLIPIGDLPDLPYQNIWIGDITNRPAPQQRVGLENLPTFLSVNPFNNLGLYNLYTGQFSVTSPLQVGQPSITQRIDMSNMPHLSTGKMWLGKINYIPPIITIDATFPYVHVTGSLNWSAPGIPPGDGDAVPTEIGLDPGYMFIGDMTPGKAGQITTTNILPSTVLPYLTFKAIWRGNLNNRPVEVFDLSSLETRMNSAESAILALQGAVGQLEVQIGALQLQIGALDTALGILTLEVQAIAATVGGLVIAVATLGGTVAALGLAVTTLQSQVSQLFNRTLDQIPAAVATVNLNNNRIANLLDPINPLDAVNLQYLDAAIAASTVASVVGTANQIIANTVAGVVTLSLPTDVIIATSLNVSTMELFNNTLFTTNTNADLLLSPNGTGRVDVTNHRIINLSDPINPLDAVNLQTLTAAIVAGSITSVVGTANQITANTVTGVVTVSLPSAVTIVTSLNVDTMELVNNTLYTTNTDGDLILSPNGTGRVNVDNSRIINLSDPINSLDAVNLQFLQTTIANDTIDSVIGTINQITASTVARIVTLSLPSAVIITTSLAAGNLKLLGNTLSSTNTNGNVVLDPNGTGNIDVNSHRIINLSDPIGVLDAVNYQSMTALTNRTLDLIPLAAANVNINNHRLTNVSDPVGVLDAVNLQYLDAAIVASTVASVSGTVNQITANTVAGAVTLSLPSSVIITTAVTAGNLELTGNTLQSNNSNGAINVVPNGSGNILLTPGTGFVGVKGTPSYLLDVFGTTRVGRFLGSTGLASALAGVATVVGTGATRSVVGSETGGSITLNTGTGVSAAGTLLTVSFATAMPSTSYAVVLTAGSQNAAGIGGMYILITNATTFTIRSTTILTSSTTYVWNFIVVGN